MDDRTYGFRLLDDRTYRQRLATELRRIGYQLGNYHTDGSLLRELDIPIEPLGNDRRFCLRLTQDAYQDWAYGTLFVEDAPKEQLADLNFDPRRKYEVSCYEVWVADIVDAVRLATQS